MFSVRLFDNKQNNQSIQQPALCKCGLSVYGKLRKIRHVDWKAWKTAFVFHCLGVHYKDGKKTGPRQWAVM